MREYAYYSRIKISGFFGRAERTSRACATARRRAAPSAPAVSTARGHVRAGARSPRHPTEVEAASGAGPTQCNLTRRSCAHGRRCAARGCTPQRALSGLARAPRRSRARRHRRRPWTPPTGGARVSPANLHDACATYFRRIRIRTYSFACANTRIIRV